MELETLGVAKKRAERVASKTRAATNDEWSKTQAAGSGN